MVQTLAKTTFVTFAEFAQWLPENRRYELHDGVIIEMPQPIGKHEQVKGFLAVEIAFMVRHLNLPYFLPSQAFLLRSRIMKRLGFLNIGLWII